ncbi:MAG TPA: hypothetical protein VF765_05140 [Polyangiaceae bacterium]
MRVGATAMALAAALGATACDRSSPGVQHAPATSTSSPATEPVTMASTPSPATAVSSAPAGALSISQLCVTEGTLTPRGEHLFVDVPKCRAVAALTTEPAAELRFTYLGPTAETTALGSGRVRRQIGLKLRAQNGCNLVYAMWRLEPKNEIAVQVKRNPGQATFVECQNRGYRNVQPARSEAAPDVSEGSSHVLRAEMHGADLTVWADGAVVWQGNVGEEALAFDGPVGLRTDNGRFALALTAGATPGASAVPRPCGEATGE